MYEKMKALLEHFINVLLALVLLGGCGAYLLINSIVMTSVINELRLDTYVSLHTGFGIVILVLLLGWGPVWLTRALSDRGSRYIGRL
tara:strand:+ start:19372 stop:19632 length:261 start_codon:yes stop_codon:yes gene_type:complete